MTDTFHIWYIALSCWEEEPYCFWWKSEVIWGHQRSKTENLVNAISRDRDDRHFSYLVYRFVMLRGRTLLILVEVKGHLRSSEVRLRKPPKRLVNTISQYSNDRHFSYLAYRFVMLRGRTLLFFAEDQGHLRSQMVKLRKCRKLLVNTISQDSNDRHFSYLVYRFVMLKGRTLLFLVEVKGHLRSPEVKDWKPCNCNISR